MRMVAPAQNSPDEERRHILRQEIDELLENMQSRPRIWGEFCDLWWRECMSKRAHCIKCVETKLTATLDNHCWSKTTCYKFHMQGEIIPSATLVERSKLHLRIAAHRPL